MTKTQNDSPQKHGAAETRSTLQKFGHFITRAIAVVAALATVAGVVIVLIFGISKYMVTAPTAGSLGYTGSMFLLLDPTESERAPVRERARAVAKSKVIAKISPGIYCAGYAIGAEATYDEVSRHIFGDIDAPGPRVRLELPIERDRSSEMQAELAEQVASLHSLSQGWNRAVDAVPLPVNRCCSEYLAALFYVEKRLRNGSLPAPVTLVVIGDLTEEPTPEPFVAPSAEGPEKRVYSGVQVLLVRPFAATGVHSRSQIDDYWTDYFRQRGTEAHIYDLNGFPGIEAQ